MHSITGAEKVSGGGVGWQKEPGHLHSELSSIPHTASSYLALSES